MPRAALLQIHARVEGTQPSAWDHPCLSQVWGPRFQVYVVATRDVPVFTLGRLPDAGATRRKAEDLATRLHALLDGARMRYDDAGEALGVHPNSLRYAALTGTVAIRWEGARRPVVWSLPPPELEPPEATRELARRFLRVFGPATSRGFAAWAGIRVRKAADVFDELAAELIPMRAPTGHAWLLGRDETVLRESPGPAAAARLLPSGDAYTLGITGEERALLVPDAGRRRELWTPRVWPGALLLAGEVVGTWRRAQEKVTIQTWKRLTRAARAAVLEEAESLPLPALPGPIVVDWD